METLKKVLICSAILVGVLFFALVHRLRSFTGANIPGKPVTAGAPVEWLAVTNGATRQQLAHTLGIPTERSGSAIDVWRKGTSTLRVTFDDKGLATNVSMDGVLTAVLPFREDKHHTSVVNQTKVK